MEEALGLRPELIEGDDGIFDVAVDGHVVFSKRKAGDFAATSDIVDLVRARLETGVP